MVELAEGSVTEVYSTDNWVLIYYGSDPLMVSGMHMQVGTDRNSLGPLAKSFRLRFLAMDYLFSAFLTLFLT